MYIESQQVSKSYLEIIFICKLDNVRCAISHLENGTEKVDKQKILITANE